jgi:hypothetical protein
MHSKISKDYIVNIGYQERKFKVMAFQVKYSIEQRLSLNTKFYKQVSHFNWAMPKSRREAQIRLYKTIAFPTLLCESEMCFLRKRETKAGYILLK